MSYLPHGSQCGAPVLVCTHPMCHLGLQHCVFHSSALCFEFFIFVLFFNICVLVCTHPMCHLSLQLLPVVCFILLLCVLCFSFLVSSLTFVFSCAPIPCAILVCNICLVCVFFCFVFCVFLPVLGSQLLVFFH